MESGVVETREAAPDIGIRRDKEDAIALELPSPDGRCVALEPDAVLRNREGPSPVHGEQSDPAGLEHPSQFRQPEVLHPLVNVGKDTVVEDEVEGLVVVRQWGFVLIAGERYARKVFLVPGNRISVDITAEQLAAGSLELQPAGDAGTAATEIEYPRELAHRPPNAGKGNRDVAQGLFAALVEQGTVPLGIIVREAAHHPVDEKIGGARRVH
jgi:hypothetical protein